MRLERMAIEASHATKTPISWTDIVNYLLDTYAKDACEDLKSKAIAEKKIEEGEKTDSRDKGENRSNGIDK